jgi:hypothetical protein
MRSCCRLRLRAPLFAALLLFSPAQARDLLLVTDSAGFFDEATFSTVNTITWNGVTIRGAMVSGVATYYVAGDLVVGESDRIAVDMSGSRAPVRFLVANDADLRGRIDVSPRSFGPAIGLAGGGAGGEPGRPSSGAAGNGGSGGPRVENGGFFGAGGGGSASMFTSATAGIFEWTNTELVQTTVARLYDGRSGWSGFIGAPGGNGAVGATGVAGGAGGRGSGDFSTPFAAGGAGGVGGLGGTGGGGGAGGAGGGGGLGQLLEAPSFIQNEQTAYLVRRTRSDEQVSGGRGSEGGSGSNGSNGAAGGAGGAGESAQGRTVSVLNGHSVSRFTYFLTGGNGGAGGGSGGTGGGGGGGGQGGGGGGGGGAGGDQRCALPVCSINFIGAPPLLVTSRDLIWTLEPSPNGSHGSLGGRGGPGGAGGAGGLGIWGGAGGAGGGVIEIVARGTVSIGGEVFARGADGGAVAVYEPGASGASGASGTTGVNGVPGIRTNVDPYRDRLDNATGGSGGNGGRGGNGGTGGGPGAGGVGGGGGGGSIQILATRIVDAGGMIDVSGGRAGGSPSGAKAADGAFFYAANNTLGARVSGGYEVVHEITGNPIGMRADNPYTRGFHWGNQTFFAAPEAYLPDSVNGATLLATGAELFGPLGLDATELSIATQLGSRAALPASGPAHPLTRLLHEIRASAPVNAIAALLQSESDIARSWLGFDDFDAVMYVNLLGGLLFDPMLGIAAPSADVGGMLDLMSGGWESDPFWGGSGPQRIGALDPFGAWMTLMPTGWDARFSFGAAGLAQRSFALGDRRIAYLLDDGGLAFAALGLDFPPEEPAGVPVPASLGLLFGAVGGLAALRRRSSRSPGP